MHLPRKLAGLAAAGSVLALVLSACASDDGDEGDGDAPTQAGFEDCAENPNTCNSGEVQQGGSITFIINQIASAWTGDSATGNSVYTVQALQGIFPEISWSEPDGTITSGTVLAAEPELVSEDPFQWTWQIREDAVWSDGTPITADDFILGWKLLTSDEFGQCEGADPASTGRSEQIESIEGSEDGKTVTVTLLPGQRNPEYQAGAEFNVWPAHIAEAQGFDIDTPEGCGEAAAYFASTRPAWSGGPWMIVDGDLENQIIKEPNPNWYGDPVNLDQIIMVFNTEESTWAQGTANNEIHGGAPSATFPADVIRQLQDTEGVNVGIAAGGGFEHLDMNLDNEQLQDLALRQAIFTAIDRQAIGDRTYGDLFPEITTSDNYFFRSFDTRGYFQDLVSPQGYGAGNVDEARAILEAGGYQGFEDGGQLTLDGENIGPFRLRATGTEVRQQSLELIATYLRQIGIQVEIEPIEDLGAVLAEGDYDIIQFGWSGAATFAAFPNQMLHSESSSNFGGYSNPEVDELVTQANNAASLDEAAQFANQANEIALADAYVMPLMEVPGFIWVTDDYVNIRDNPLSGFRATYHDYAGWGRAAGAE
jgi:peptide/nickel transport system substrate-binding protein